MFKLLINTAHVEYNPTDSNGDSAAPAIASVIAEFPTKDAAEAAIAAIVIHNQQFEAKRFGKQLARSERVTAVRLYA